MAERQFGPYKLIRQIAVGGMAEIHLAKTAGIAGFEKYVALKMIHPNFAEDDQFIQMLVDEAKIAVQLTHGNIAQTFDLGRVGETYYITMEYVDGADLYKILRRASEQNVEMPLDVCAFIGKEVASALDHAHRKRDHAGKSLGIVHRDVSPQNVLVSYAGEVKLVDFGIAKATMKARQTAVGVIKGKYYYMSPEQAWGDPIDYRSDIFSAGIVLYEMITGQMLYLEEDLHKLLEMARNAVIAPPGKIRRGVPPQLERIVMRALAKIPGERYQSAGDFATDLERFLHAYSPVFTTSKLASLLRQVVGDPMQVPDEVPFESIEFRDGELSTHPLDDSEVAHAIDREDLRDENSMIFRVSELARPAEAKPAAPKTSTPPPARPGTPPPRPGTPPPVPPSSTAKPTVPQKPLSKVAPRVTRPVDPMPELPRSPTSPAASAGASTRPLAKGKIPQVAKPRQINEDTRQLESPAPADPFHDESSGLFPSNGKLLTSDGSGDGGMLDDDLDSLDNIGERTLVTAAPGVAGTPGRSGISGFMMDFAGNDDDGPVEATLVTAMPTGPEFTGGDDSSVEPQEDDLPTMARDFELDHPTRSARPKIKGPPPPALAAKIHAPAVSELRKPRASRRTPPGGMPIQQQNVLAAIVSSQASEPMPAPRPLPVAPRSPAASMSSMSVSSMPSAPPLPQQAMIPHAPQAPTEPFVSQFPSATPGGQAPYNHDASGLPMGIHTPPGMSVSQVPGVPSHLQPYIHMQGMPPGYAPQGMPPGYAPQVGPQMSPQGYPQLPPGAQYPFQPTPQPMSITGQMRLYEVDELPSQYQLNAARRRWFTYIVSGVLAVSVAAVVTFIIIRSMRDSTPVAGSVYIDSVPAGADVLFDDGRPSTNKTPFTLSDVPVGQRVKVHLELAHYEPAEEEVYIPKSGGRVEVIKTLTLITGTLTVVSEPSGAEVWINREMRGHTPLTLKGVDMNNVRQIELRLKDHEPLVQNLTQWPKDGKIEIHPKLVHAR